MEKTTLHTVAQRAALELRTLYEEFGYTQYRMGRFEEYDLYAQNRSFITGSSILTFTDLDGRLMALKPDVTLSLIKNSEDSAGFQKVYYQESVYRASDAACGFREIQQIGLECIGDFDLYTVCEVTNLAALSLAALSPEAILNVSHMGLLSGVLEDLAVPVSVHEELLKLAEAKNLHDLDRLCRRSELPESAIETLKTVIFLRGELEDAIGTLCRLDLGPAASDAVGELAALARALRGTEVSSRIYLEPSLQGDPGYYNGVILKGYLPGIPTPVLSGGRYDGLAHRFGKSSGAMGFAITLNLLERWGKKYPQQIDTLILDDGSVPAEEVCALVRTLREKGESVRVDRTIPQGLIFRRVLESWNMCGDGGTGK